MSDENDHAGARDGISHAYREREHLPGHQPGSQPENPELRTQFDAARSGHTNTFGKRLEQQNRETWKRDRRVHATPVSKAERDALKTSFEVPQIDLNLKPEGIAQVQIEQRVTIETTRRIHFIESRLLSVGNLARDHFDRSR